MSRPLRTCCSTVGPARKPHCTWPPITSSDKFGKCLHADRGVAHEGLAETARDRHRHQVSSLERQFAVNVRIHGDDVVGCPEPGVAVGCGAGRFRSTEAAPAPGLFSSTMGCPSEVCITAPALRSTMSLGPPGGYGTITRTARSGQSAACEARLTTSATAPAKATRRTIDCMLLSP